MSDDGGGYDGGGYDSGPSYNDGPSYHAAPSPTYDPEPSYETGRTSRSPVDDDEPRFETGRSSPPPVNDDEPRYQTGRSSPNLSNNDRSRHEADPPSYGDALSRATDSKAQEEIITKDSTHFSENNVVLNIPADDITYEDRPGYNSNRNNIGWHRSNNVVHHHHHHHRNERTRPNFSSNQIRTDIYQNKKVEPNYSNQIRYECQSERTSSSGLTKFVLKLCFCMTLASFIIISLLMYIFYIM